LPRALGLRAWGVGFFILSQTGEQWESRHETEDQALGLRALVTMESPAGMEKTPPG